MPTVASTRPSNLYARQGPSLGILTPDIDLHHVIERDEVFPPIIELCRAGGSMRRHLARLLERTAIFEVGGDAGAAEGVVADFGGDAGRLGRAGDCLRSDEVID
jgi:hypothetical protein